jgi:hypothetical protein
MPFKPEDLLPHLRVGAPDAPGDREVYSRDALENEAPEDDREEYMAAADTWVLENRGRRYVAESEKPKGNYYLLPRGTHKRVHGR